MSRIAGLYAARGRIVPPYLSGMLAASASAHNWSARQHAAGHAALGWCGWDTPPPVSNHEVIVVMDGMIYNSSQINSPGGDAGIVASLYDRHGFPEAMRKLNGDFAIALYDLKSDTLWLARDRFGIKPLYYAQTGDYFAFASRPRALLSLPGASREVNRDFVALYAASHYRYIDNDSERSAYAGISQLPAGQILEFHDGHASRIRYWSLNDLTEFSAPEKQLAEEYHALLSNAVSLRLGRSERPAFTLSGGMDSSSVLALAVELTGSKQHAFSTVYRDKTYDESHDIRAILNPLVARWHPQTVEAPDVLDLVRRMIGEHDEPVATATWLSHYLLCEEAANAGAGSLFGGLGGDELNAGEYEYFLYHFADLWSQGETESFEHEVELWSRYHTHPIYPKNRAAVLTGFEELVRLNSPGSCLPDRRRLGRYVSALNPDYPDLRTYEPVMDHPFSSYLKNRTYQDLSRETIPPCLRAEDRHAIAFGIDHFQPFLDHRVVEFMFRVPGQAKIRNGITKHLLREAMRGIIPEETRTRVKKTGWNAPAHLWFSGLGRDMLLDLVTSRPFRERGIYNLSEVERIILDHDRIVLARLPEENHMMFLWQLVNLELWLSSLTTSHHLHAGSRT